MADTLVQRVVVGLGNPGKKYAMTRHNIGALVVDRIAATYGWEFKEERRFEGWVAKNRVGSTLLHLLKPATYMNESGRSVRAYLDYFKLSASDLLIVSDDVELPFGELRWRLQGGSGGHNGLKSLESYLGTQAYARLRMGVGKELQNGSLADYVLDNFRPEEFTLLPAFIDKGVGVVKEQALG